MVKVTKWLKYWGQLFLLPIYGISFLFPRDKELWLFGSSFGRRFADNPRYFYQYCVKNKVQLNIHPIWISHDKEIVKYLRSRGFEAYVYYSLKGFYYAIIGKVYLYDNYSKDINFWQSGGAIKINMWHGIPLKKIQADNKNDKFRHPKNLWEKWRNLPRNLSDEKPSDYVLTTSENLKTIFSSAFRTNNVITYGYPRIDYLISDKINYLLMPKEQEELDIVKYFLNKHSENVTDREKHKNNYHNSEICDVCENGNRTKIIYYMPTFRDSEVKFFEIVDLEKLQKYLNKENILFCVKLHPKSKLRVGFDKIADRKFENILVVDMLSDPYVILKVSDLLVTDYSSVYFDFLLLDRPIIFFDYDREEYITKSRELYFNYEEMTPGEKAETMEGLIKAIGNAINPTSEYEKKYKTQRRIVRDRVFDTPGEMSCPKLANGIKSIIGG